MITLPLFPAVDCAGAQRHALVLIVLYATFFVSLDTMIMKTFIDEHPRELEEAASVDGATVLQTLFRVILPLSRRAGRGRVFVFVFSWNEFLFAFIFTTRRQDHAAHHQRVMGASTGVDWGVLFAAVTIQLVPIAFLMLLQRDP